MPDAQGCSQSCFGEGAGYGGGDGGWLLWTVDDLLLLVERGCGFVGVKVKDVGKAQGTVEQRLDVDVAREDGWSDEDGVMFEEGIC